MSPALSLGSAMSGFFCRDKSLMLTWFSYVTSFESNKTNAWRWRYTTTPYSRLIQFNTEKPVSPQWRRVPIPSCPGTWLAQKRSWSRCADSCRWQSCQCCSRTSACRSYKQLAYSGQVCSLSGAWFNCWSYKSDQNGEGFLRLAMCSLIYFQYLSYVEQSFWLHLSMISGCGKKNNFTIYSFLFCSVEKEWSEQYWGMILKFLGTLWLTIYA